MNRRYRFLLVALTAVALLWLLLATADRALSLAQRFLQLPFWLQWTLGMLLALFALTTMLIAWMLLRPRRRKQRTVDTPSREHLDTRIARLESAGANMDAVHGELRELDSRGASGRLYVAMFGEISCGKSSLIAALVTAADVHTDVRGGTTRVVRHYDTMLDDGVMLTLVDVPGSRESSGEAGETAARNEVLRAHAVIYLVDGDLNRRQGEELRWLADFGKPLLLVLNKSDRLSVDQRVQVLDALQQHAPEGTTVVAISAGGNERFQRRLPDGHYEQVERRRTPDIAALRVALRRLLDREAGCLEPARTKAVLTRLDADARDAEATLRSEQSKATVRRYARRAVLGAMAAVAPGSDLIIQGALAMAMVRELARIHEVSISDVQAEDFLRRARMTVRTSTSLVLAVAGNTLKAFPGLGTLGGGVLHAFAYALIFDSLGKALAATLEAHHALDADAADKRLKQWLSKTGQPRLKRLAALTVDAMRTDDKK